MLLGEPELKEWGAEKHTYPKDANIFVEDGHAHFFYQIHKGFVRMVNLGENTEYVQGYFHNGESFGEPPLFGGFPYPSSAIAVTDAEVWLLPKEIFLERLRLRPELLLRMLTLLSIRMQYKAMLLREITCYPPEHQIVTLIEYFKHKHNALHGATDYLVPFTRQQIADMLGLRVETVIRAAKKLVEKGELENREGKLVRRTKVFSHKELESITAHVRKANAG
jgi:CRP-like cAMP-binding protein